VLVESLKFQLTTTVELDPLFLAPYPADIVGVVFDTPSALSNAERATVGVL